MYAKSILKTIYTINSNQEKAIVRKETMKLGQTVFIIGRCNDDDLSLKMLTILKPIK